MEFLMVLLIAKQIHGFGLKKADRSKNQSDMPKLLPRISKKGFDE
jgi:hypothetical protein